MYEGIIFDIDGTIINTRDQSDRLTNEIFMLLKNREAHPEEKNLAFSTSINGLHGYLGVKEKSDEALTIAKILSKRNEKILMFSGMRGVLKSLSEIGIKLGIVTSRLRAGMENGLNFNDIYHLFEAHVSASDVFHPKPHPESVLLCLEIMQVEAKKSIFVGDSISDMKAAHAAGVSFALAGWGVESRFGFEKANYFLDKPSDVLSLLEK